MRRSFLIIAVMLSGCATKPPNPQAQARHQADNIAAAARDDYRVVNKAGQTLFCPSRADTGTHVMAGCLTEAQWERRELWVWSGSSAEGAGAVESGHPFNSGSLAPYVGH